MSEMKLSREKAEFLLKSSLKDELTMYSWDGDIPDYRYFDEFKQTHCYGHFLAFGRRFGYLKTDDFYREECPDAPRLAKEIAARKLYFWKAHYAIFGNTKGDYNAMTRYPRYFYFAPCFFCTHCSGVVEDKLDAFIVTCELRNLGTHTEQLEKLWHNTDVPMKDRCAQYVPDFSETGITSFPVADVLKAPGYLDIQLGKYAVP